MGEHELPSLGLYIHIPWCVKKCPYCDFNSHNLQGQIPEEEYVAHLLNDFEQDYEYACVSHIDRKINTIFIGGGTPSLLSFKAMRQLLDGIKSRSNLEHHAEITMEANPGTVETEKFYGFVDAGINRMSIGIQSFKPEHLRALGRVHNKHEAAKAATLASQIGLNSFNLDLMHGLPNQSIDDALQDLKTTISFHPSHLSWYQLTIEPNTSFASKPPVLPEDDLLWDIQEKGHQLLLDNGYLQYEISGYSKPDQQCQHNLNYWRFGDYIGIGCGAHGKLSNPMTGKIERRVKVKHPKGYMDLTRSYLDKHDIVENDDIPFEFFMNRFRLLEPCPKSDYESLTYRSISVSEKQALTKSIDSGLLIETQNHWQVSEKGRRYLNSLLSEFV